MMVTLHPEKRDKKVRIFMLLTSMSYKSLTSLLPEINSFKYLNNHKADNINEILYHTIHKSCMSCKFYDLHAQWHIHKLHCINFHLNTQLHKSNYDWSENITIHIYQLV